MPFQAAEEDPSAFPLGAKADFVAQPDGTVFQLSGAEAVHTCMHACMHALHNSYLTQTDRRKLTDLVMWVEIC